MKDHIVYFVLCLIIMAQLVFNFMTIRYFLLVSGTQQIAMGEAFGAIGKIDEMKPKRK